MAKRFIILTFTCLLFTSFWSCIEEDFFGLSPYSRINAIEVSNQSGAAEIRNDSNTVKIPFPKGINLQNIEIRSLSLSSFATADLSIGDIVDFTDNVAVNVTAEDGTVTQWILTPSVAGDNPQLPNSDFNTWYQSSGGYLEPGQSAESTIWGTGNPGTQLIGVLPTIPIERSPDDRAAQMMTEYNGDLPATFGTPISAGSIFVGKFDPDNISISDPNAAIDFGSPFAGRPTSFKITYSYVPGPENLDKNQEPLPFGDACDIYLLLELRGQNSTERLATGWFRSEETVEDLETIEIAMHYGPLDDSFPDYMFPENGAFVPADSAAFVLPTHLTFVASSSFGGADFAGAVGSTLVIDDLELVYD